MSTLPQSLPTVIEASGQPPTLGELIYLAPTKVINSANIPAWAAVTQAYGALSVLAENTEAITAHQLDQVCDLLGSALRHIGLLPEPT